MVLPSPESLIAKIKGGNHGVIDSEYPYFYAHQFITAYPETIPADVQNQVSQQRMISTPARTAAATLQYWADKIEEDKHALAIVLADTYLSLHHGTKVK